MDKNQRVLLDLLKRVNDFFEKNEITYYLAGGNTLGAIRHKGFIPWDDDIDLYIKKSDFEKLTLVKERLKDIGLSYVDNKNFPGYGNVILRLVEEDNTMITPARIADGTPKGKFIEIFILDPLPKDEKEKTEWRKKRWIYLELISFTFRTSKAKRAEYIDKKLYKAYIKKCEEYGLKRVLEELEQELFSGSDDCDEYILRWAPEDVCFKKEWFEKPRLMVFEDSLLPVPQYPEWTSVAEYGYGWMYYPKELSTNHNLIANQTISYKEYINDYSKFINKEELIEAYWMRKVYFMDVFFARMETLRKSQELYQEAINLKCNKLLEYKRRFPSLSDYQKSEIFAGFERQWKSIQFGSLFTSTGTYLDIGDENLTCILLSMIKNGEYISAFNILEWKEKSVPSEGKLKQIFLFLFHTCNAYTELYGGNSERAFFHYEKSIENSGGIDSYDQKYLNFVFMIEDAAKKEEMELIRKKVHDFACENEDKSDIIYLKGKIEEKLNNTEQAVLLYKECAEQTNNGMIHMFIKDYLTKIGENYD